MAIKLRQLLKLADEEESFTLTFSDGTTATKEFKQRNLPYGDGAGEFSFGSEPPFIINDFDGRPVPAINKNPNSNTADVVDEVTNNFVRGGVVTLGKRAVKDLERYGKVILSPKGIAWTAAQLALSRTNPVGPIPEKDPNAPGDTNEGLMDKISGAVNDALTNIIGPRNQVTLPLNTGLTVGTGAAGIRFRKDGLLDADIETGHSYDPNRGGDKYDKITTQNAKVDIGENALNVTSTKNRLFNLYGRHILKLQSGMDSVTNESGEFGGAPDFLLEYGGGAHSIFGIGKTRIKKYRSNPYNDIGLNGGYIPFFNKGLFDLRQGKKPKTTHEDYRNKGGSIPDNVRVGSPISNEKTRVKLYKLGNPGTDIIGEEGDPAVYNIRFNSQNPNPGKDKISATPIFTRTGVEELSDDFKDYIKFRIAVVNTDTPTVDKVILFRAFLDNISDNFNGDWNSYKYNGRAEEFYTYSGFSRTINFSFKIHCQSRDEQQPLWNKLNYLVAQTAPEYRNRRMRGVFSRLTIGDWMHEIPGFFTSINLQWNTSYPWEIKLDPNDLDNDVNQYPHILDVSCNFQPVHNFAPVNSETTPFILPNRSLLPKPVETSTSQDDAKVIN